MNWSCAAKLPDPFLLDDGSRVRSEEGWQRHRVRLMESIVDLEYGGLPPKPASIDVETLHSHSEKHFDDAQYTQYRIVNGDDRSFHFRLDVLAPQTNEPLPVILTGDGCYLYLNDAIKGEILSRGFAVAVFSRTAIVPDLYNSDRDQGLYLVYPEHSFGALAAWAWGYHRAIDALEQIGGNLDTSRIAITGHSRGGKTVLLAGAVDDRVALTAPNASGLGGAGSFLFQGPGCETLEKILKAVPYWFGPKLKSYLGREHELPFDQHMLKALVAPRAYFNANGLDDLWANPSGTWQTHMAAREVYRFLGAEDRIGHWYRPGGHDHGKQDWLAFLEFTQWQFQGREPNQPFDRNPYPDLEPAFSWKSPR